MYFRVPLIQLLDIFRECSKYSDHEDTPNIRLRLKQLSHAFLQPDHVYTDPIGIQPTRVLYDRVDLMIVTSSLT